MGCLNRTHRTRSTVSLALTAAIGLAGGMACGGGDDHEQDDPAVMLPDGGQPPRPPGTGDHTHPGREPDLYVGGMEKVTHRGGLVVALWSDPGPPRLGFNTLTLAIRTVGGAPVFGHVVRVIPDLHDYGSNSRPVVTETEPGVYQATNVELHEVAVWELAVVVEVADGIEVVSFFFDIQ
jgi:hypothetical protein